MTVDELMERLSKVPSDLSVAALYDCRCAGGNVIAVELGLGSDDPRESVLLVIE